jgi:glutathione synthase/RimK-type ligase-like ATP-grasp enzyme
VPALPEGRRSRRPQDERTVLIVCGPGDEHAISVALHLADLGVRAVPVDLARLPERGFAVRVGTGRLRGSPRAAAAQVLLGTAGGMIDPATCAATWWRRPRTVESADATTSVLTEAEWTAALTGMAHVVGGTWVNDPGAEEIARRKLVQLEAAREVGLAVPPTLVTNDLSEARRFVAGCQRRGAVMKSLSSLPEGGLTRAVRADDGLLAERLRLGPAILQERVDGLDLRVTVVGGALFAMSVDARAGGDPDDVRASWDQVRATARPARLPDDVAQRIMALQRRLGLHFGAVDLRRRRGGGYAFLEVNPSGQWLHAEQATGHPIGATLARLLATSCSRGASRKRERDGAPPAARAVPARPSPAPGTAPVQAPRGRGRRG